jgi:thiol-disulfide isomerase/thioredoxin
MTLKQIGVIVFSLFFVFLTSCAKDKSSTPELNEKDIFGASTVNLKDHIGKAVLVNFWATWCPPCVAEIPDLNELYNQYKDKFTLIGVSVDREDVKVIQEFYLKAKMSYPVIRYSANLQKDFGGVSALPTTFVINKKGKIVDRIIGYRDKATYEELIKYYIEEK